MVYTIPEERREKVASAIKRFQKKAAQYGAHFSCTASDPYCKDETEVFDVTCESDVILCGEWSVVSLIEHLKEGNIVNGEFKQEYVHLKPFCAHCNANHNLKRTFVVSNGREEKQVGCSCLKDYTGIFPESFFAIMQMEDYLSDSDISHGLGTTRAYLIKDAIAASVRVFRENGYVKSSEPRSNKELLSGAFKDITDEDLKQAQEIIDHIGSMKPDSMVENMRTLIRCGYCKQDHFGYIAYAPLMVERDIEFARKLQERAEEAKKSQYVGEIGQRITVHVTGIKLVTSVLGEFGLSCMYKFTTDDGNSLIWWTASYVDTTKRDWTVTIKGHSEYNGERQTNITRCKALKGA